LEGSWRGPGARTSARIEGDDLIAWVAERVAPRKRIRAVRFVEAIPKTPSGKDLRRILVERDRQSTGVTRS
jgi:acyl-coenzyme A synthetase/AMP-(fatty) acid ligase